MMKILLQLCLIMVNALSGHFYKGYIRSPQRTVMFGGYYGGSLDDRSYIPQDSRTFASGDTITTNAFIGDRASFETSPLEETIGKRKKKIDDHMESETYSDNRKYKKKQSEDNDEDELLAWPFNSRATTPFYSILFPIMIGGETSHFGRKAENDGNRSVYPGAATAIANSFSTGKGGVATSRATSFGDPYSSTLFKNSNFNKERTAEN